MKKPTYILTKELSEHLSDLKKRLDFLESESKKHKTLKLQYEAVISKLNKNKHIDDLEGTAKKQKKSTAISKDEIICTIKETVNINFINKLYRK